MTDMLAVVVLIDGTGHRPRPPEWWPEPTTRCGVPLGPRSTLTFYGHAVVEDMPLCGECWPAPGQAG